jgi:hypothetical protein
MSKNGQMPAPNKHIGKMSAEVTVRIFAHPLTVSDSPSCGAVDPTLRQYAGTLSASGGSTVGKADDFLFG